MNQSTSPTDAEVYEDLVCVPQYLVLTTEYIK